jgi:hypothetical protein
MCLSGSFNPATVSSRFAWAIALCNLCACSTTLSGTYFDGRDFDSPAVSSAKVLSLSTASDHLPEAICKGTSQQSRFEVEISLLLPTLGSSVPAKMMETKNAEIKKVALEAAKAIFALASRPLHETSFDESKWQNYSFLAIRGDLGGHSPEILSYSLYGQPTDDSASGTTEIRFIFLRSEDDPANKIYLAFADENLVQQFEATPASRPHFFKVKLMSLPHLFFETRAPFPIGRFLPVFHDPVVPLVAARFESLDSFRRQFESSTSKGAMTWEELVTSHTTLSSNSQDYRGTLLKASLDLSQLCSGRGI